MGVLKALFWFMDSIKSFGPCSPFFFLAFVNMHRSLVFHVSYLPVLFNFKFIVIFLYMFFVIHLPFFLVMITFTISCCFLKM